MAKQRPQWLVSLISINVAATVIAPLLEFIGTNSISWKGVLYNWANCLAYTNITGVPAILIFPPLLQWTAKNKRSLLPVVVVGCLGFAIVGCLVAQELLSWTGVPVSHSFWNQYFHTLAPALILALAFGLGTFFYGTLRDRLRDTREQLHEQTIKEERAMKLAAEARLRSLESRVHPHFLFNTLNSISSLIAVDPPRAEQAVGKLASLLRSSLDHTNRPLIALSEELAMVEDYLAIEKLRLSGKLSASIQVPVGLLDARVPPFAVQSLVENAVKHGITPQKSGGKLSIRASASNGEVCIEVCDSGAGFDSSAIAAGHGLDNLVERLNTLFGSQASLNFLRRDEHCVVQLVVPRS
jgi:sensor histidine kinase YesM